MSQPRVALFLDFENLYATLKRRTKGPEHPYGLSPKLDFERLVAYIEEHYGTLAPEDFIVVANFSHYNPQIGGLNRVATVINAQSFMHPRVRRQRQRSPGKRWVIQNYADMRLAFELGRHVSTRPVYFGLVNAAVLALAYDRAAKRVESRLFLEDDFPPETSPEAHVRLARIEAEYEIVTRAAVWLRTGQDAPEGWFTLREGEQAVALVDGPLELWGIPERGGVAYKTQVQRMTRLWDRLRGAGVPLAGYVDRPRADLVVRALAVARPDWEKGAAYPWPGVLDRHLYGPLLQPGWRSPVFAIWTEGMKSYPEEQRVHFFYMHVGGEEQPGLARVEIPAWVAQHPAWVDLIHRALWVHLQQSGRGRYPYALHRAHQEAVVTYKEREELETLLVRETVRLGLPVPGFSAKQRLKEQDRRPR